MERKVVQLILIFSFIISQSHGSDSKCENEGCYEVIKTFANLLEEKINETDKILAEAERELNEVTLGSDEKFQNKLLELDNRLNTLISEMNTGIEGGEQTLFEMINSVFKAVNEIESNSDLIELTLESGNRITIIAIVEMIEIKEVIKKVQEEFEKLKNQTDIELPNALQDAFDKSENFHSDTKEIGEIVNNMKAMLADYERNLLNAKDLTSQTLKKFSEVSKQIDSTSEIQKEIEDMLKDASESELPVHEMENIKKLVNDAMDKAKSVFDDSLELLNEVSLLELYGRFDGITKKIKELDDYSENTAADLKKILEESSDFFNKVKSTIDKADTLQTKAISQQNKLKDFFQQIQDIQDSASKAIGDKEEIISNARNIYKTLEDFNMKVEESRENARRAMEKIPEIKKKISNSKEIIKNLEDKVEENFSIATEAKEKCTASENQMENVLMQSDDIKNSIETLADELDATFDFISEIHKINEKNSKDHDNLKRAENETENVIQNAKEKVDRTRTKGKEVDDKTNLALENLQTIMKQIQEMEDIDMIKIEEFETKIIQIERELEEAKLLEKYKLLKQHRQEQDDLIEKYRVEIAILEHEVETIKENANTLENRCFKRTRLEP